MSYKPADPFVCSGLWMFVLQWYSKCWQPGLVNYSSVNTAYIYWGSLWGQTCCSVIDGKIQLKHASAAKTVTW